MELLNYPFEIVILMYVIYGLVAFWHKFIKITRLQDDLLIEKYCKLIKYKKARRNTV